MAESFSTKPAMALEPDTQYEAVIQTTEGSFKVELLSEVAPQTVNNFVFLAQSGFYNGVVFHRIIESFMIQTGDPTGTGRGGPGYRFEDELPPALPYGPGVLAMANAGPNTNGSQFFVCTGAQSEYLNQSPNYSVFGRVTSGMDIVQKIAATPVGRSESGEQSKPLTPVKMEQVEIVTQPA